LRKEPQSIFINEAGKKVVQQNCLRCHSDLVHSNLVLSYTSSYKESFAMRQCWDCHRETPHGRVHSLSSVPYARVPVPGSSVPGWLNRLMKD
jgi:cytochrome c nitrite reductase small subunit